jgi:hypothetical protein
VDLIRQTSGPWSFDDEPPASGERLTIARREWCLDAFAKLGCPAKNASRFPRSLKFIRDINREPQRIEEQAVRARAAEIHRSTWELTLILRGAARLDRASSRLTDARLREIQRGPLAADASQQLDITLVDAANGFPKEAGAVGSIPTHDPGRRNFGRVRLLGGTSIAGGLRARPLVNER